MLPSREKDSRCQSLFAYAAADIGINNNTRVCNFSTSFCHAGPISRQSSAQNALPTYIYTLSCDRVSGFRIGTRAADGEDDDLFTTGTRCCIKHQSETQEFYCLRDDVGFCACVCIPIYVKRTLSSTDTHARTHTHTYVLRVYIRHNNIIIRPTPRNKGGAQSVGQSYGVPMIRLPIGSD